MADVPVVRYPKVGETVIYLNRFGHPRAAIVTGTQRSLVDERHVTLIHDPLAIHLTAWSPLPRFYELQSVPHIDHAITHGLFDPGAEPTECWLWPDDPRLEGRL